MSISLGVDTGGTYTDAVLVRDETEVIAAAKALTTRHDLSIGIGGAVQAVLDSVGLNPEDIALASLSTTLATNALVEGQGGRVGLIYIGFRARDLENQGLNDALNGDPVVILSGGHDHTGQEACALDEDAIRTFLEAEKAQVSAFAVAGQFAVRNPDHEQRAMALVREITGHPVSASHQLSAKLGGPKRALTAVLNARLIGMIDQLITRAETTLSSIGIDAPMMVVRGDGALISADQARERPIETILSGPAASIVGASWMTGTQTALISDIGGTTTDVALLRDGKPQLDPDGARVGPHRTMVEAVAMRTTGLGGDSEVHFQSEGLAGGVILGPQRLIPVSLIALEAPEIVHAALDAQLRAPTVKEHDGRFVRVVYGRAAHGLPDRDARLLDRVQDAVVPLANVLRNRMDLAALKRLVTQGLVQISGATPSDACHVLGHVDAWDGAAARKALEIFGRRRTGAGVAMARDPEVMATIIVDQLTHQTGLALLEAAFAADGAMFDGRAEHLARHELMQRGLQNHGAVVRVSSGLGVPVVGLGASAGTYYPAVGHLMGTEMILPEHADVANAIGAVVGRITMRQTGTITAPSEGLFRVHFDTGPEDFAHSADALSKLETVLSEHTRQRAIEAGATDVHVRLTRDIKTARAEAREVFVEATITAEASGRPRITSN